MYKKEVIERIYNEPDKNFYHPYPLDKITACLEVVDVALDNLETTIQYVENLIDRRHLYIHGWETASTMDRICEEFNIKVDAKEAYKTQENNEKLLKAFPFGSIYNFKVTSEEFGQKMTYEEYFRSLAEKSRHGKKSGKIKMREAVFHMFLFKRSLQVTREKALAYITRQGCWADEFVSITAEIETSTGAYWEVITLPKSGQSFKRISTTECMEKFITDTKFKGLISINRQKKDKDIFCGPYIDFETVVRSMKVIQDVTKMIPDPEEYMLEKEEWVKVCKNSTVLQRFIRSLCY